MKKVLATAEPWRLRRPSPGLTTIEHAVAHLDVQQLAAPELQRRIAWRDGFLAFSAQSPAEVVDEVNRYSSVRLEIADPELNTGNELVGASV